MNQHVACTNTKCTQANIPKTNRTGAPAEQILCGECGQTCTPTPDPEE